MFNKPGVFGRNDQVTRRDAAANNAATNAMNSLNSTTNGNAAPSGSNGTSGSSTSSNSWNASPVMSAVAEKSPIVHRAAATPVASNVSETLSGEVEATNPSAAGNSASTSASTTSAAAKAASTSVKTSLSDASTSEASLIVGPDVKLKGAEILDCDTLVVEGRVEATMDSRVIRIAENGSFSGKVSIDVAEIHGSFDGELTARSQLIIHSTGRVSGTIRFGTLVVDEGGELCGDINVLVQKSEKSEKPLSTASNTLSASSASNTSLAKAESPQARSEAAAA